jgi:hypothetical protein
LQELANDEESDEAMEDSDEEDMKRIISKNYGSDSSDDSNEEMKSDGEEGESEMDDGEEMESS